MRRIAILFAVLLVFTGVAMAQTIENFESLKMNIMLGGAEDLSSFTVVPNPASSAVNPTAYVVEFLRDKDGVAWGGFYATLANAVDFTDNKYIHLKVKKSRISPVRFKIEGGETGDIEIEPMNPQTLVDEWEELVFDFSTASGPYSKIVLSPDREDPLALTEDITVYFDEITLNNDPDVGSAPVYILENYESIPINMMLGGVTDESNITVVPNPDISDLNLSPYVGKLVRDKDGVPWCGFWSQLPTVIDVTTNKFVHVKVLKTRITTLKFKIEGGAAGTVEIASKYPQTKINQWEDIVFDFSDKTGTYPIVAFMPDFEDPLSITGDITVYFDDIMLNNDPNPISGPPQQTINVDMNGSPLVSGEQVFISGALGGVYGQWAMPGTIPDNEMLDDNADGIYSITLTLPDGVIAFKFFIGADWSKGDEAVADRTYTVNGSANLTYVWGVAGLSNVGVPKSPLAGKVRMYPNPVSNELFISSTTTLNKADIHSVTGQVVGRYEFNNTETKTINTSALSKGVYFITVVGNDGSQLTQKIIKK